MPDPSETPHRHASTQPITRKISPLCNAPQAGQSPTPPALDGQSIFDFIDTRISDAEILHSEIRRQFDVATRALVRLGQLPSQPATKIIQADIADIVKWWSRIVPELKTYFEWSLADAPMFMTHENALLRNGVYHDCLVFDSDRCRQLSVRELWPIICHDACHLVRIDPGGEHCTHGPKFQLIENQLASELGIDPISSAKGYACSAHELGRVLDATCPEEAG